MFPKLIMELFNKKSHTSIYWVVHETHKYSQIAK